MQRDFLKFPYNMKKQYHARKEMQKLKNSKKDQHSPLGGPIRKKSLERPGDARASCTYSGLRVFGDIQKSVKHPKICKQKRLPRPSCLAKLIFIILRI